MSPSRVPHRAFGEKSNEFVRGESGALHLAARALQKKSNNG